MQRMVIVTVDTLAEVLKDYLGEENVPTDATVVTLLVNKSEQGKFALTLESDDWNKDLSALVVDFQVKRYFSPTK